MEPLPLSTSSTESGNNFCSGATQRTDKLARSNKFSEIEPLLLAHARQSQETKLAVKENFCPGATVQN